MIYLPKRGVFLHVPRTGGNSITAAIASVTAGRGIDCFISTGHNLPPFLNRHQRVRLVKQRIREWDSVYKFAVYRDPEERMKSYMRLRERDLKLKVHEHSTCTPAWAKFLLDPNPEQSVESEITYWAELDYAAHGIDLIPFEDLTDRWPEICDNLQIPRCALPHLNKGYRK